MEVKILQKLNINRQKPAKTAGFTLIEILVVVVIIGLLASFLVPKVIGHVDSARVQTAQQNIASISQQLKLYRLNNFIYPTTEQGLKALVTKPTLAPIPENYRDGGYIEKLPLDPWNREFQYLSPGKHHDFDLWSMGPDGVTDGEGGNKDDLTNW